MLSFHFCFVVFISGSKIIILLNTLHTYVYRQGKQMQAAKPYKIFYTLYFTEAIKSK